ncbi:PREDICTED: H2.0-like homeobox protein [Haliaeetus leucocephalus]|uniref:H2.0-like homeobox protein n=1 Tax=Haliaeetus leucocephalus TaxID=52644 RepID=UPI00053CD46E|nr:PREDICTED: H2.0-like homeobox protein [Haliaeetus leucocephalus]
MYTAGLAPFYASNFSLWSAAYCSASGPAAGGCFPLDAAAAKKPSFCIADILHAGGEAAGGSSDSLPGGPGTGMPATLGAVHHGGAFPAAAAASPLRPTPVVRAEPVLKAFAAILSPLAACKHPEQGSEYTGGCSACRGRAPSPEESPRGEEAAARYLTSLLTTSRQTGVHLPNLQPAAGQFFASLDPINEASAILGPLNTNPRSSVQHQFQDTFPGPYAVLTKDTLPQTYKRKRSWSRAVFSNLQRKGLEKRFEIQKYVTKPDRKQLAAMLGLTDAQVEQTHENEIGERCADGGICARLDREGSLPGPARLQLLLNFCGKKPGQCRDCGQLDRRSSAKSTCPQHNATPPPRTGPKKPGGPLFGLLYHRLITRKASPMLVISEGETPEPTVPPPIRFFDGLQSGGRSFSGDLFPPPALKSVVTLFRPVPAHPKSLGLHPLAATGLCRRGSAGAGVPAEGPGGASPALPPVSAAPARLFGTHPLLFPPPGAGQKFVGLISAEGLCGTPRDGSDTRCRTESRGFPAPSLRGMCGKPV